MAEALRLAAVFLWGSAVLLAVVTETHPLRLPAAAGAGALHLAVFLQGAAVAAPHPLWLPAAAVAEAVYLAAVFLWGSAVLLAVVTEAPP